MDLRTYHANQVCYGEGYNAKSAKGKGTWPQSGGSQPEPPHASPPGEAQEHTRFLQQQVVMHVKSCLPGCLSEAEHQGLSGLATEAPSALHVLELQKPRGEQVFSTHGVVQCRHSGHAHHLGSGGKAPTAKFPDTSHGPPGKQIFQGEQSALRVNSFLHTRLCTCSV